MLVKSNKQMQGYNAIYNLVGFIISINSERVQYLVHWMVFIIGQEISVVCWVKFNFGWCERNSNSSESIAAIRGNKYVLVKLGSDYVVLIINGTWIVVIQNRQCPIDNKLVCYVHKIFSIISGDIEIVWSDW